MRKLNCILLIAVVLVLSCNNKPSLKEGLPQVDDIEEKKDSIPDKEIKSISNHIVTEKPLTLVLWENDYFNLEIAAKYASCEMGVYDATLSLDTIEITSEMGCSITSIPFELTALKLNSVKVEQAHLESIVISQPPMDGFDRAGLDELILQSNWVTYESKNGFYVPFSTEDSSFVIKGKPKLTTAFITKVLEKSDREVAPELLEGFMKTNREAYWVNCTTMIRITGLDVDGKRIVKYVVDNELCLQD